MSDEGSWDKMRKAKEEAYFDQMNKAALARLNARGEQKLRKSPITGETMQQEAFMGVVIDRCPTSGGIWLDKGELEEILKQATNTSAENKTWLTDFFSFLSGSKT